MKPILIILMFTCIFYSCDKEKSKGKKPQFELKVFNMNGISIRAIEAVDKDTIYFAGSKGKIGGTNDGGKSWNIQTIRYQDSIQPNFRSIAMTNNAYFVLSIANPALLYKIDKTPKLVYTEHHEKVFYDSMKFFNNGKDGIAVGDPIEDCPCIIKTYDSGNKWIKIPCDKLPKLEKGEAFFAASNSNIKIINNTVWIASGGTNARILKSKDKGNTWEIIETPIIQGNEGQGIYSIDFYDENNGFIVGGNYAKPNANFNNKAVTKNGGKTWSIVANNENPNYKSCVQYVPNKKGKDIFAVGKTGISFSKDGGYSWKELSKEGFYTIQFIDEQTAWLGGHEKLGLLKII